MVRIFYYCVFLMCCAQAALANHSCSDNVYRNWWDVKHYVYDVRFDVPHKSIHGRAYIHAHIVMKGMDTLQIDLHPNYRLGVVSFNDRNVKAVLPIEHGYKVVVNTKTLNVGDSFVLMMEYSGKPPQAKNAPWDGGFIMTTQDSQPWWAVAVQGVGASAWLPCKDYAGDEPDHGATLRFVYPSHLQLFSNGKLIENAKERGQQSVSVYRVHNPINLYNLTFYLGKYTAWQDSYNGKKGVLPITFAVLPENYKKAIQHFKEVKKTLQTFEYLYGPYPFYEDGFKMIQSPYLGMEHQGAIAYGNGFQHGYLGKDRSGSDSGLLFDFIIVHEMAHEWFGNNLTALHPRDNWIQEGFTTYAEVQYLEKNYGEKAAMAYHKGKKQLIKNNAPLVDTSDICANITTDQYDKGAYIVHMLRRQYNDDDEFQDMLRELNQFFKHQVITSKTVEDFFQSKFEYMSIRPFFKQYLNTTAIPKLVIQERNNYYLYHFENVVEDFEMILPFVSEKGYVVPLIIGTTPKKTIYWPRKSTRALWDEYLIEIEEE